MLKSSRSTIITISILILCLAGTVFYILHLLNRFNSESELTEAPREEPVEPAGFIGLGAIYPLPEPPKDFTYEKQTIPLTWTDDNTGENLIIQSDKKTYFGFNRAEVYFSITNQTSETQETDIYFWFANQKTELKKIDKLAQSGDPASPLPRNQNGLSREERLARAGTKRKDVGGYTLGHGMADMINAGATNIYQATLTFPPREQGEFFIEAIGERLEKRSDRFASGRTAGPLAYGHLDPWYSSNWTYRLEITIDADKVASHEIDFPVLATTTLDTSKVRDDGYDIVFTASDGQTILNHEREYYSSSTGELVAWIKTDVSSTTDTVLYLYYGNPDQSTDMATTTGVWDNNYVGVWHMEEATSTVFDSTANGNDSQAQTITNQDSSGQIDGSIELNSANSDIVDVPDSASLDVTNITMSAWVNPDDASGAYTVFAKTPAATQKQGIYAMEIDGSSGDGITGVVSVGSSYYTVEADGPPLTEFSYVTITYDGEDLIAYYNANVVDATSSPSGDIDTNSGDLCFGARNNQADCLTTPTGFWDGIMDELRISNTARSAGWIKTEYNNQKSVASFMSFGTEDRKRITKIGMSPTGNSEGLVGYWTFNGPDMNWGVDKNNRVFDEKFENASTTYGYDETWSGGETVDAGCTLDENADVSDAGSPSGWGSQYLKAITGGGNDTARVDHTFASDYPIAYTRIEVIADDVSNLQTSEGMSVFEVMDVDFNTLWHLKIYNDGGTIKWNLIMKYDGSQNNYWATFAEDTRYRIEVLWDNTNNDWEWRINGTTEDSGSNITVDRDVRRIYLGINFVDSNRVATIYLDNIAIDTSGWVGPVKYNVTDRSGQGHHGDIYNGPGAGIGKIGQGMDFDGVDDYVDIPGLTTLSNDTFSVTAWFNIDTLPASNYRTIFYGTISGANDERIRVDVNDVGRLRFVDDFSVAARTDPGTINTDTWYFVAATYDYPNLNASLYLDGDFITTDSSFSQATNNLLGTVAIGRHFFGASYPWDGLLDEVRIYNRALSATEITKLYNAGTARINSSQNRKITDGLVGLWSFNGPDMNGLNAMDRSGQGNHGTLTNGPKKVGGKVGQALEFDEVDDYVQIADSNSLKMTSEVTISTWFKTDGTKATGWDGGLAGKQHENNGVMEYNLSVHNAGYSFYIRQSNGTFIENSNDDDICADGKWHHLVGVADSSTQETYVYIDGVYYDVGTQSYDGTINTATNYDFYIGQNADVERFNGLIDEVRIYNRALTPKEIKRLYNMGVGVRIRPQ